LQLGFFEARHFCADYRRALVVLNVPDRKPEETLYHIVLFRDAGFVDGGDVSPSKLPLVSGLTGKGRELLDNVKAPGIWAKTQERVKSL
jgi:hypothetical protein